MAVINKPSEITEQSMFIDNINLVKASLEKSYWETEIKFTDDRIKAFLLETVNEKLKVEKQKLSELVKKEVENAR